MRLKNNIRQRKKSIQALRPFKDSLPKNILSTHINLNDNTSAGIECAEYPAFSVQYHPESSPGPHDSRYLFKKFIGMMDA